MVVASYIKRQISPFCLGGTLAQNGIRDKGKRISAWKYLLKSLHILLHWIAWCPGSGESILLGKDRILGMGDAAILSEELIYAINLKGVFYLFQASSAPRPGLLCPNWLTSVDLELEGHLALEWTSFRCALIYNGVQLVTRPDELRWTGGDASGLITVKNIYEATEKRKRSYVIGGWWKSLWTWDFPLKLNLFIWLVAENKILTWENLQRRGFIGPSYCILCKQSKETVFHLFAECPFALVVWEKVFTSLNCSGAWSGNSISECFKNWISLNTSPPTLSAFICWFIWIDQNHAIFEDRLPSAHKVAFQSLLAVGDYSSPVKALALRRRTALRVADGTVGWFDGAAISSGLNSGVGGVIRTMIITLSNGP
jgi:hypothetical protein